MKRERDYRGVYSNGKRTFDLEMLNSTAEMKELKKMPLNCLTRDEYYATPNGTIVNYYSYNELEDWYADLGPIYSERRIRKVLAKNCKKIKEIGETNPELLKILKEVSNEQQ